MRACLGFPQPFPPLAPAPERFENRAVLDLIEIEDGAGFHAGRRGFGSPPFADQADAKLASTVR